MARICCICEYYTFLESGSFGWLVFGFGIGFQIWDQLCVVSILPSHPHPPVIAFLLSILLSHINLIGCVLSISFSFCSALVLHSLPFLLLCTGAAFITFLDWTSFDWFERSLRLNLIRIEPCVLFLTVRNLSRTRE